jgi:hypothetical protein
VFCLKRGTFSVHFEKNSAFPNIKGSLTKTRSLQDPGFRKRGEKQEEMKTSPISAFGSFLAGVLGKAFSSWRHSSVDLRRS